jgi:Fur family ferric uptake transcriptional regulator
VTRYEHEYGHEHHDHLICERCRRSIEVVDPRIEELQEKLARDHGFVMTRHKLDMFGICSKCMAKGKK